MDYFQDLKETTALSDNDLLFMYAQENDDPRKIPLSLLLEWFQDNTSFVASRYDQTMQYETVSATGFSITATDNGDDIQLVVTAAAAYAAGTLVLPVNPTDQQEVWYYFDKTITSLTIDGGAAAVKYPVAIATASYLYKKKYDETTNTWYHY